MVAEGQGGRRHRPLGKFDALAADVRGIQERLRNHVNTDLRKLHAGQKRIDRKLVGVDGRFNEMDNRFNEMDNRFNEIDDRFYEHDSRFDSLDDSVGEILNLVSFMVYGGASAPDEDGQTTLWGREDDDEPEEA